MKFCSKCVTPETAETHIFNKNGACSVCSQIKWIKLTNIKYFGVPAKN